MPPTLLNYLTLYKELIQDVTDHGDGIFHYLTLDKNLIYCSGSIFNDFYHQNHRPCQNAWAVIHKQKGDGYVCGRVFNHPVAGEPVP